MKKLSILLWRLVCLMKLQYQRPSRHDSWTKLNITITPIQETNIIKRKGRKKGKNERTWSSGKKVTTDYALEHWRLSRALFSIQIQKKISLIIHIRRSTTILPQLLSFSANIKKLKDVKEEEPVHRRRRQREEPPKGKRKRYRHRHSHRAPYTLAGSY